MSASIFFKLATVFFNLYCLTFWQTVLESKCMEGTKTSRKLQK